MARLSNMIGPVGKLAENVISTRSVMSQSMTQGFNMNAREDQSFKLKACPLISTIP